MWAAAGGFDARRDVGSVCVYSHRGCRRRRSRCDAAVTAVLSDASLFFAFLKVEEEEEEAEKHRLLHGMGKHDWGSQRRHNLELVCETTDMYCTNLILICSLSLSVLSACVLTVWPSFYALL